MKLGFVGLSHLGLCTSICLSSKGTKTVAFDQNLELINKLHNKELPLFEPNLQETLEKNSNIEFTNNLVDLRECNVVYIAVDIKTNERNESDLSKIEELIQLTLPILKKGSALVIHSQVPPGFTRKWEYESKKYPIEIYYQVEVLIFGQAVQRVLEPERYMIGCLNSRKKIHPYYQQILSQFGCPIFRMRYESAELAKISINIYLSASVSVSNTIAEIAEKIGADWQEIIPVLRLDKRIGQYAYLNPGLGISGGNLERDLASIVKMSNEHGTESSVVKSFQYNSKYSKEWPTRTIFDKALKENPNAKIGIIGLAYKKDTNSIKNSPALEFLSNTHFGEYLAYDPEVKILPENIHNVRLKATIDEVLKGSDVLLVFTPWDEFKQIDLKKFTGKLIVDPYRILEEQVENLSFHYCGRGLGNL